MNDLKDKLICDLVLENPQLVNLFEEHNIDFCCKGNRKLSAAIAGLAEKDQFINELNKLINLKIPSNREASVTSLTLTELCTYIKEKHHCFVEREIPEIEMLFAKVLKAHGQNHPKLFEAEQILKRIFKDIRNHLNKEETTVFPIIKYIEDCKKFEERPKAANYKSIGNLIGLLEEDHSNAGSDFNLLRDKFDNYIAPEDACTTYKLLLQKIVNFEKDLHIHILLENSLLFPKAKELENFLIKTYRR